MAFNDFDDSNDRPRYRNYAQRIGQREEEGAIEAKLVVMGNTSVGKTSLVTRYTQDRFTLTTTATTGALFVTHRTEFDGFNVKLQIWDTAGTELSRLFLHIPCVAGVASGCRTVSLQEEPQFCCHNPKKAAKRIVDPNLS